MADLHLTSPTQKNEIQISPQEDHILCLNMVVIHPLVRPLVHPLDLLAEEDQVGLVGDSWHLIHHREDMVHLLYLLSNGLLRL